MEFDDEANEAQELEECETCGGRDFYLEGGFYYCKECLTQSQGSRHFVEEEQPVTAGGFSQSRVSVLRAKKKSTKDAAQHKLKLSSWEIYNFVLKALTNKLIDLGFPMLLRDTVLQLWTDYLIKRKAIFISKTNDRPSTVTQGEPLTNIYALYDRQPKPLKKWGKSKERKREAQEEKGRLKSDEIISSSSAKRRTTRDKKQAFEKSYLDHFDNPSHVENAATSSTAASGVQSARGHPIEGAFVEKSRSTGTLRSHSKLVYSEGFQRIRREIKAKIKVKKVQGEKPLTFPRLGFRSNVHPTQKQDKPFISFRAGKKLKPESFTMRSVLILLFVSLRQIGSQILLSDILRLYHEGTLCIDNIGSLLSGTDLKLVDWSGNRFLQKSSRGAYYQLLEVVRSTEAFLNYMGIEIENSDFPYPKYTQFIPKYIQDLKLPCEFEYFIKQQNKTLSIEDIVKDLSINSTSNFALLLKLTPELFIISMFIFNLKMLFGLDDVTERYQSAFASKFNEIMDRVMQENRDKPGFKTVAKSEEASWGKLFVLEEWFCHHNYRERVIQHEEISLTKRPYDTQPNLRSTHRLIQKFGGNAQPRAGPGVVDASDKVKSIFQDLSAKLRETNSENEINRNRGAITGTGETPTIKTLNLPKEDVIADYVRNYPNNVSHQFVNVEALTKDFRKMRVDFIYEPGKYIGILNKAGYKVNVMPGDATQYSVEELCLKERNKTLVLFQPFRMYDDFMGEAESMKFLLKLCSSSAFAGGALKQIQAMVRDLVERIGDLYCKRCRAGSVPLPSRVHNIN